MKEFRIAKCLCYAGTEYAEVKECAIFKDDSRNLVCRSAKNTPACTTGDITLQQE